MLDCVVEPAPKVELPPNIEPPLENTEPVLWKVPPEFPPLNRFLFSTGAAVPCPNNEVVPDPKSGFEFDSTAAAVLTTVTFDV